MFDSTPDPQVERIREIRARLNASEAAARAIRDELVEVIKETLPPVGERGRRGLITEVVKASEWTRAYVDGIRDGTYS